MPAHIPSYVVAMLMVRMQRRRQAARQLVRLGLACLLLLGALPAPATAVAKGYELDLATRSDFVAQTNFVQCVGASMQMMLNIIKPGADRTAKTQLRLQELAREWSGVRPDGFERQGASVRGWATGLNLLGAGPYKLIGTTTIEEALLIAARAIRSTGKPVGMLMWRGRHAWVMSGFRATADPLRSDAKVTAVFVEDPLYPHGSSAWGPSPAPGASLSPAELGLQFVPRRMSSRWNVSGWGKELAGKYVLVLPYELDLSHPGQRGA
jgi:hypothetical protein